MKITTSPDPRSLRRLRALATAAATSLVLALMSGFSPAHAASAPPERMSYQGYLVDNNAAPLGRPTPANYPIVFRIFDEAEGGNRLWAEQQVVTVDNGNFSVILGEGTPVAGESNKTSLSGAFAGPTADRRYLGIQVTIDGTPVVIQPRLRLLPAPYSFAATQATQLVNPSTGQAFVSQAGTTVTVAGTVDATGGFTGLQATQIPANLTGNRTFAGNVGIGTTTPNYRLSLGGDLANTKVAIWDGGATAFGLGVQGAQFRFHLAQAADRFSFLNAAAGTEVFTIRGNGQVGIGTATPNFPLSFGTTLANTKLALWDNGANGSYGFGVQGSQLRLHLSSAADRFSFLNGPAGTEVFTINGSGLIGVPSRNAIEFGVGLTKEVNNGKIGYQTFSTGLDIVGAGADVANRRITFHAQGGSQYIGNVGIGTAPGAIPLQTDSGSIDNARIQISNGGNISQFGRTANYAFVLLNNSTHNTANRWASFDGDSNWDFQSDRKLKKDIIDVEPMLDRALKVQVRRFRWKDDAPNSTHKLGVIAQEVQPLFPDMVTEVAPPDRSSDKVLTVGYGDFAVIAIKALQELNHVVEAKDARITSLERELAALRKQVAANGEAAALIEARFAALEKAVAATPSAAATAQANAVATQSNR